MARKTVTGLPAIPVLVGVGYPSNLRSTKGTRPVNRPGGRTGKKTSLNILTSIDSYWNLAQFGVLTDV
ncbi:MAG: hypothetical protein ACXAEU_10645 [Candidatus Hodarchaeales archaeon]